MGKGKSKNLKQIFGNKTFVIIVWAVVAAALITALTFLGIFLYQRYTPSVRFAKAQDNWVKAKNKSAQDDIVLEIQLGKDEDDRAEKVLLEIYGDRIYRGNNFTFDYDIDIIYKGLNILRLDLSFIGDGNTNELIIAKNKGFVDFETISMQISNDELRDIELGRSKISLYDTDNITIDKEGAFSIRGNDSISFLLQRASIVLKRYADWDINGLLEQYANISRVSGVITYDGAFRLNSFSNNQNISVFMPWEDGDELINSIEDIPENIKQIYFDRKLVIPNVPIVGNYIFNFQNMMPDGILVNIRIVSETRYKISD